MWVQQQHDGVVGLFGGHPLQPLFDVQFPVVAGGKPLFVEPDLMTARMQVVAQPPGNPIPELQSTLLSPASATVSPKPQPLQSAEAAYR